MINVSVVDKDVTKIISNRRIKEVKVMKKQNLGFAFLLLGLIFAVPADSLLWWIGAILGVIGLLIVATNSKESN